MKKFITYIAQQPKESLIKGKYSTSDDIFKCDFETSFPVMIMINSFVEENEEVEILAIIEKDNEKCKSNLEVMKSEIEELKKLKKFEYNITEITISGDETYKEHLYTFEKLLGAIKEKDELYVCATYGTKPFPIIEMMAVNAATKIKRGVNIGCISYGRIVRGNVGDTKEMIIYDITPLFLMNRLVDNIAELSPDSAEDDIKRLLEEEGND